MTKHVHYSVILGLGVTGNRHKLTQHHCRYDLRIYTYTNRVILIWNSISEFVVSAETVNTFKWHIDKFWSDQDDQEADLHGGGNRSTIV